MKRLNVKLALWLVGITVFSVVGVYFLHGFQEERNADFLKKQAEQAATAGNDQEAVKFYGQYLRHRDDRDAYREMSKLVVKLASVPNATARDFFRAYGTLEEAIRKHPDLDDVRISLVDYTIGARRYPDALDHIRILKERGSKDISLSLKEATCYLGGGDEEKARKELYAIVGYDPEQKTFADQPPATATQPEAFMLLARLLRSSGDDPDLADQLMLKLVEWNPDLAKAHLMRASYLMSVWQMVRGDTPEGKDLRDSMFVELKDELKATTSLEPDNADAMLLSATVALVEKDYATAQALLDQAVKLHPTRPDVYSRRAATAIAQQQPEKAKEELEQGLKQVENKRPLLEQLVELQVQLRDYKGAKATCEEMRKLGTIPLEFIRFQEAKLQIAEGNVLRGVRELERIRPALERLNRDYLRTVNLLMGRSYAVLSMPDRQLEMYRRVLSVYPDLLDARVGEAAALQALGRHAEAEATVAALAQLENPDPAVRPAILQLIVTQQMQKPEAQRDWKNVDKLAEAFEGSGDRGDLQKQLLRADLLVMQGKSDEALALLSGLRKQHSKDVAVWLAICKLMTAEEKYRNRLPDLLKLAEKEVGPNAALHAERIKVAAREPGEQAVESLKKLEADAKQFDVSQQKALMPLLGAAYLQVNDYDDAKRCLLAGDFKDPNSMRTRLALFDLALQRGDKAAIDQIVEDFRKSPDYGSESATYRYCWAAQQLREFGETHKGQTAKLTDEDHKKLSEVRKVVEEAIAVRGEWAPLWTLRAAVDQYSGDFNGAIAALQRSLSYSRTGQADTARRLVTLLYATRRFSEANDAMQYLEGVELGESMRKLEESIKFRTGDTAAAMEMVKKDIETDPENPSNYLWYGELLEASGDGENAEKFFRKATEKGPELAGAWEFLVRRLMANQKKDEAVAAVAQAEKTVGKMPLAMGRLYERLGEVEKAEKYYQQALAEKPGDLSVMQHLAEFYAASKDLDKLKTQLDALIATASQSKDPNASQFVAWARTRKAQSMAPDRDYAGVMEAVKLVEQNAKDGELSRGDLLTIASMLAPRINEPGSREKAIEVLEKLRLQGPLGLDNTKFLARLYDRSGQWERARDLLMSVANENDVQVSLLLADLYLRHDAPEEALRQTELAEAQLRESLAEPSEALNHSTRLLRARLLAKEGNKDEAGKILEGWLPRPLPQNRLSWLIDVAGQMESIELFDQAERLYNEYASLAPAGGKLPLAAYHGRRGDIDNLFALIEQSREDSPILELVPLGLSAIRSYPDKVSPERQKMLETWIQEAVPKAEDPHRALLTLAELYDLQGRYDEVEKIYRSLLADEKISKFNRAVTQNNLAFVLSVVKPDPKRGAEAEKLISEAIAMLGPTSDLIDTRALAYLAQGKVDLAAADLKLAIDDQPSMPKYYHLAQLEKRMGNDTAARDALAKAQELAESHNQFSPIERKGFEQLKSELN